MISVVDLAFELWFADSGQPEEIKDKWRRNVFDPLFLANRFTPKMELAFKHAITVLRLAGGGAFVASPVGYVSTEGMVH